MRAYPGCITAPGRTDWTALRETIDLAAVATSLLGPAPGRRGEHGRRLWWSCPFHEDVNPSLCVTPGESRWKCFGCGQHGDAASLVMRLQGVTFPEALAYLSGGPMPDGRPATPRQRPAPRPPADAPARPSGMPEADALAVVEAAVARLWTPEGVDALAYLTGPDRRLTPETIRAGRLGWAPRVQARTKDGRTYTAGGIVVPWFDRDRLALLKIRQPEGRKPKYAEIFRNPDRPPTIYPGPEAIRQGRPLVIVEGEFDAMVLGQELSSLGISVVTLGSASSRPGPAALGPMLAAPRWFIATDRDAAGDRAASGWPSVARRVQPPLGKDWTEARQGGVDLARWWRAVLDGDPAPPLFTWPELAGRRWGPAVDDPEPGIVIARNAPGVPAVRSWLTGPAD